MSSNKTPQELVQLVEEFIDDMKGVDTQSIAIGDLTSIADWMVVVTGTSTRHVKAIADNVAEKVKAKGFKVKSIEGGHNAEWILLDLFDVIVHVMLPHTRTYYDLERLWSARPSS